MQISQRVVFGQYFTVITRVFESNRRLKAACDIRAEKIPGETYHAFRQHAATFQLRSLRKGNDSVMILAILAISFLMST